MKASEVRKNIDWFRKNVIIPLNKLFLMNNIKSEIFSLYRTQDMNNLINGSQTSLHLYGLAADITVETEFELIDVAKLIQESNIPYSKIVIEDILGNNYIHISSNKKAQTANTYIYNVDSNRYELIYSKKINKEE